MSLVSSRSISFFFILEESEIEKERKEEKPTVFLPLPQITCFYQREETKKKTYEEVCRLAQ